MLVRAATGDQALALIAAVQRDGTCWRGPTVAAPPGHAGQHLRLGHTAKDIKRGAAAIIAAAARR